MGRLPLVVNQHFTGNLDHWDPAVLDGLAKEREGIAACQCQFKSLHEKGGTANGKNASRASTE